MFCNACGHSNPHTAAYCANCGAQLPLAGLGAGAPAPAAAPRVAPREPATSAGAFDREAFAAVVGPKNTEFYLSRFARLHAGGSVAGWHWPALLVTFLWGLHRRMFGVTVLAFFGSYLVGFAFGAVALFTGMSESTGTVLAVLTLYLLPPLFATWAYYGHCKRKIAAAQASTATRAEMLARLTEKGGTGGAGFILVLVFAFIFVIGILAAVALPAYQDYTVRAKTAEAAVLGKSAALAVEQYYRANKAMPATVAEAGVTSALPSHIEGIYADQTTGVVSVSLILGKKTGSLLFTPRKTEVAGVIDWVCSSEDIRPKDLPHACR